MSAAVVAPASPRHLTPPAPEATAPRRFRPDIQGLRAIAVLSVVLYHAHVPGVRGGYVGVDVFFVISGFLITGQLVREVGQHGRIRFGDFYARRIRRLLPPAVLVAGATVIASRLWAAPLQTKATSTDSLFTVFYGLNYRLASEGIDYQRASAAPSPLQHYWSLAVEEQFYLVWPLLIMLVVLVVRRGWRRLLFGVLIVGGALSFVVSLRLTTSNAPLAYFSMQSRAWELAAGALVGLLVPALTKMPRWLSGLLAPAGLALIIGGCVIFNDDTVFPGLPALVPVGGAALVIAAGCAWPPWTESVLLRRRPVQGLGRVSYSWYLWHWPVLILAPAIVGHSLAWPTQLALMGGALLLAIMTFYLLEQPLGRIRIGSTDWIAAGLVTSLVATTLAVVLGANALSSITSASAAKSTFLAPTDGAVDPFASTLTAGLVTPSVVDAINDVPSYPGDCIVSVQATKSPECLIAPDGSLSHTQPTTQRVVLIGDSHSAQFFDPIQTLAAAHHWSVEVLNKVGCPLATIETVEASLHRTYTECDTWRANALQRLAGEPAPQMIFVSELNRYGVSDATLERGWQTTLAKLRTTGAPVVYLKDTPFPNVDVPTCLSGALAHWSTCAFKRSNALFPDLLSTASFGLAATVDLNQYLCPGTGSTCPAVRDGVLLYRDDSHVTSTAMKAMTALIDQELVNAGIFTGTAHPLPVAVVP